MSAETLRQAAALMRERAEAARHLSSPWVVGDWQDGYEIRYSTDNPLAGEVARCADYVAWPTAEHIASWHPAVALAVADWLDADADVVERHDLDATVSKAYTVARAYLGESA